MRAGRTLLLALGGAVAARAALAAVSALPGAGTLARINFRGRRVGLAGGPALAVAGSVAAAAGAPGAPAAAAALVAGLGCAAVGRYDDVVASLPRHRAKGVRGHLRALREGRLTSGVVKIAGAGTAGLAAAALLSTAPRARDRLAARRAGAAAPGGGGRRPGPGAAAVDLLLGAGVIAGTANLVNLLDLRPGRALKAGLLAGAVLAGGTTGGLVAGPAGAAAGLLPVDLAERTMLGDCGANALGALLGVALAAGTGRRGRTALLAGLVALTAASERVSFTTVIERTAGLRELDALGRLPAPRPRRAGDRPPAGARGVGGAADARVAG